MEIKNNKPKCHIPCSSMHYSDWLKFHGISGCHMWIIRAKCSQYPGTDIQTFILCVFSLMWWQWSNCIPLSKLSSWFTCALQGFNDVKYTGYDSLLAYWGTCDMPPQCPMHCVCKIWGFGRMSLSPLNLEDVHLLAKSSVYHCQRAKFQKLLQAYFKREVGVIVYAFKTLSMHVMTKKLPLKNPVTDCQHFQLKKCFPTYLNWPHENSRSQEALFILVDWTLLVHKLYRQIVAGKWLAF